MSKTLIILAHPNRKSFSGAWAEATEAACRERGEEVAWSDLVAQGFDAVERAGHYGMPAEGFDPLKAQEGADRAPRDVAAEIAKLKAADRLVFHFPIWWFGPPAVLKGWFDRVLMHGDLHTVQERFDTGRCRDKTALFCVTTGASEIESGPDGREGDVRLLLWPAAQTLRYLGMRVLEPLVVHGVHGYHEGAEKRGLERRLADVLEAQAGVMAGFGTRPAIRFNADTEFDAEGRLRREAESFSPFIRHRDA